MIEILLDEGRLELDQLDFVAMLRTKAAEDLAWEPSPAQRELLSEIWDKVME
jgi:hypothetical protein